MTEVLANDIPGWPQDEARDPHFSGSYPRQSPRNFDLRSSRSGLTASYHSQWAYLQLIAVRYHVSIVLLCTIL